MLWKVVLASSIPLLLVGVLSFFFLTQKITESIYTKNEFLCQAITGEASNVLKEPFTMLNEIALLLSAHPHSDFEIDFFLDNTVRQEGYFETIYLVDSEGKLLHAGLDENLSNMRSDLTGIDLSGQNWFKATKMSGRSEWSDIFLSPITGRPALTVSVPFGEQMLVGNYKIGRMDDIISRFTSSDDIIVSILDRKGVLIHFDGHLGEQRSNLSNLLPVIMGMAGIPGTYEYTSGDAEFIGSISSIPETGWLLLVSQNLDKAYSPLAKTKYIFLGGLAIAALIVGFIAMYTTNNILHPLFQLRASAREIAGGKYDYSMPQQQYSEIEELAASFRHMSSAIKSREDHLKESEDKFRSLVESLQTIPYRMDIATRKFTYIGHQVQSVLGYPESAFTDFKSWLERVHHDDREMVESACNLAAAEGLSHNFEYRMISAGGGIIWVRHIVSAIRENNIPIELASFILDITRQKQSEEKFIKAFRSNPTFLMITTLNEGQFIEVNDTFIKACGYSRDELMGHTSTDIGLWVNPNLRASLVKRLQKDGSAQDLEAEFRKKSGEIISVLLYAESIELEGRECILAVVLNITDRKKLEHQLLQAQKMESIGTLAGGVAHDFNNILTAIITYSQIIKTRLVDSDKGVIEKIDKIFELADRATQITHGLLAFSRKQYYELAPIRLNNIIRNFGNILRKFIREDIEIKIHLSSDEPLIMADSTQIEQILMNLATNARDAMPEGGSLTIETATVMIDDAFIKSHGFGIPGAYVLLSVSDTGEGIAYATQEKMFEPFFTTKDVGKGTGLGLAIVYGIVQGHEGFISVDSSLSRGSTFRIYLPETKADIRETEDTAPLDIRGGSETILIAEDEAAVRDSLKTILEEFGYKVIEAIDGKHALDKFNEHKDRIDLVLLDIVMPGMNGRDVYKQLKLTYPEAKAIFMSGYTADIIKRKSMAEDNVALISKPFLPEKLLSKVREVLDG